jgi:hypothetical protein
MTNTELSARIRGSKTPSVKLEVRQRFPSAPGNTQNSDPRRYAPIEANQPPRHPRPSRIPPTPNQVRAVIVFGRIPPGPSTARSPQKRSRHSRPHPAMGVLAAHALGLTSLSPMRPPTTHRSPRCLPSRGSPTLTAQPKPLASPTTRHSHHGGAPATNTAAKPLGQLRR